MKACSACGRLFPADAGFCPADGTLLADLSAVPAPPDPQDARVGRLVCGRYEVRRVVADGGTGRIYEAIERPTLRHVALKILHADVVADEVVLARFRREFEVSRLLTHRHVVEVIDLLPTEDGSVALVMEYLHGEVLRGRLWREGTLAPDRLVRMVSQLALALDEAHALRLVHRDLKPDNLFLCPTTAGDRVKILDFGSVRDNTASAKKLTVLGTTIGSPFYMAPEQAQGLDTLDHRADVWALAAIVYECVTGRVPFSGNNGPSILFEILTREPSPPSRAAAGARHPVPAAVDRVLAGAFQKDPARRTPSVGALADALGAAYGLDGDHRNWAVTSQEALAGQLAAERPLPPVVRRPPAAAVADAGGAEADAAASVTPATGGDGVAERTDRAAVSRFPAEKAPPVPVSTRPSPAAVLLSVLLVLTALGVGMLAAWLFALR